MSLSIAIKGAEAVKSQGRGLLFTAPAHPILVAAPRWLYVGLTVVNEERKRKNRIHSRTVAQFFLQPDINPFENWERVPLEMGDKRREKKKKRVVDFRVKVTG